MAEKTIEEKIFTIPLRYAWETERPGRAKKAISIIKKFLEKHMKGEVKLGLSINENVWKRGIQKPPRKVRVHAKKDENTIYAEIIGIDIKTPSKEEKKHKEDKQKEKVEKIVKERKERKKMTIQDELAEGDAKLEETAAKEEVKEEKKEIQEKQTKSAEIGKKTGHE